jgi:hypothetical protein
MTSPEVVRVPVDHVRAHAGSVDEVAAGIATARDAGARVQLGGSAYGHLCAFLPAAMTALGDRAVHAFGVGRSALAETGDALREVATRVASVDDAAARRLRALLGLPE